MLTVARMRNPLRCLTPCLLYQDKSALWAASTCLHFHRSIRSYSAESETKNSTDYKSRSIDDGRQHLESRSQSHDAPPGDRHVLEQYPRIQPQTGVIDYKTFRDNHNYLRRDESGAEEVVVRGASRNAIRLTLLLAHALKEEYGHIALQAPSLHLLISSKMIA